MKITSRDKELICLVLSIGLVAASWFLGAKNIEKKTEEMTARKEELRQEYDERIRILQQKDEYIQKTKDYDEAYTLMLGRYPGDISQVQQIMFVTGAGRTVRYSGGIRLLHGSGRNLSISDHRTGKYYAVYAGNEYLADSGQSGVWEVERFTGLRILLSG